MNRFQRPRALWRSRVWLCLWALCPLWATAQPAIEALDAADPRSAAPTPGASAPIAIVARPETPDDPESALRQWINANRAVADFPRGHIDLLRWEGQNLPAAPEPAPSVDPLLPDEAWRLSLAMRPDLLAPPALTEAEAASRRSALLAHSAAVQRAWIDAVATRERQGLQTQRLAAARNGAELGRRMVLAGNWSQARLLREQLLQSREQADEQRAGLAALQATEALAHLLGVWRPEALDTLAQRLPSALPEAPPVPAAPPSIEAAALASLPLLAGQRQAVQRRAAALDAGGRRAAWALALQQIPLPDAIGDTAGPAPATTDPRLFSDHDLRSALTEEAALLRLATERRSLARQAWARLNSAQALLQTLSQALALQTELERETTLRYNGMLQSTWELLDTHRERLAAADALAQARRDRWLAALDWQQLLAGARTAPAALSTPDRDSGAKPAGH
jgi:hypothetical protein